MVENCIKSKSVNSAVTAMQCSSVSNVTCSERPVDETVGLAVNETGATAGVVGKKAKADSLLSGFNECTPSPPF